MTEKQFTVHTKEENWETEDGIFARYRHFLCNDGNIVIELNSHINDCWDFADILNNLYKENEQLKQKIKLISEILTEDIGYVESFRKIEEALK